MRYSQPVLVAMAALAVSTVEAPPAHAQDALGEEGFGFFYDSLAPYGDWINVTGHGPCWRPEVQEGWSPYTDGYWAYTDVGWTWVSHEPFGSIVYHYGRWVISNRGWCWVPGADWSPAWVSWRTGEDYIGWAPLPPEVQWHPQRGISTWVDVQSEIGPAYYRFCAVRDFSAPVLTSVLLRPSRNAVIMVHTENVTQITLRNSNVYCGGPRYDWVSANASGGVPLLRVAREENVRHYRSLQGSGGGVQNFVYNNILVLPAPRRVEFSVAVRNFPKSPTSVSVSKGWYSDPSGNERLKSHISREWEQRRTTQPLPGGARDSSGPSVRLTSPTAAEKRAALHEFAGTPAPSAWAGSGRSENGRGVESFEEERPIGVPKAQPVRPQAGAIPQRTQGGGSGFLQDAGTERGAFRQPVQGGAFNGGTGSGARIGGEQPARPEPSSKTLPRSVLTEVPERIQAPGGQAGQSFFSNQPVQGVRLPQDNETSVRTQPKAGGGVSGSGVSPLRPLTNSPSGFTQPPVSRTGANFSQPVAVGSPGNLAAPGGPSRVGAQSAPFGGTVRSGVVTAPVQAAPLPRAGQPAAIVDQPARFQRTPPSQSPQSAQTSPAAPSAGGVGVSGGGRPQSSPPVSSASPPSAPAAPAGVGAGQKKRPGDPGYVPGNP